MTAQQALTLFNNWDITDADLSLWSFRKRNNLGQVSYTAKWINTDESLTTSLGAVLANYQGGYRDTTPYDLLHEPLQAQFVHVAANETHASLLIDRLAVRREENTINSVADLDNITGYILRISKNNRVAYAVKKTDSSFKAKKAASFLNAVFTDDELKLIDDRTFRLENKFDFILFEDYIFIHNKTSFESLLDFRQDFIASFQDLLLDTTFSGIFDNTTEIENFVGRNMVHLRRMSAVKQKGHYRDANFMANVRRVNSTRNWGIQFDLNGKIVLTNDTAKTIITILLDHRLLSELTSTIYDVSSSTPV